MRFAGVLDRIEARPALFATQRFELLEPLRAFAQSGRAVFGTCAGAILLCSEIIDGRARDRDAVLLRINETEAAYVLTLGETGLRLSETGARSRRLAQAF